MKVDLHTHSHFSDGTHPPDYVLNRAQENGVTHLALTDHDCLEGFRAAARHVAKWNLHLLAGVEISTRWENQEIHVIGLCVDADDAELNLLLERQQQKRRERMENFDRRLVKAGITGLGEYIGNLPCVSPGRAHVARFLASRTTSGTPRKAFRSLARNGRFYVPAEWCSLTEAIACIRAASGIPVLAHPHRYSLGRSANSRLLRDFCAAGGEAMEISCSSMTDSQVEKLARTSLELNLLVSAGSDFHTSEATWMDIGRLRRFPESVKKNAIWEHPGWHC